jgi:DNA modification methylase
MGSGTFGIAALKLKRKFIGVEIDPERFKVSEANISKQQ